MKRLTMSEFAASINGGIDVIGMQLASMGYEVHEKRRIENKDGRLTYKLKSGTTAYILSGDVLYLKNGDVVEVV